MMYTHIECNRRITSILQKLERDVPSSAQIACEVTCTLNRPRRILVIATCWLKSITLYQYERHIDKNNILTNRSARREIWSTRSTFPSRLSRNVSGIVYSIRALTQDWKTRSCAESCTINQFWVVWSRNNEHLFGSCAHARMQRIRLSSREESQSKENPRQ